MAPPLEAAAAVAPQVLIPWYLQKCPSIPPRRKSWIWRKVLAVAMKFVNMSAAKPDLSYRGHTVHFWTIPYSAIEGRLTAENTSKKGMLRHFREVYGEALEFYAVFRELHAESSRSWERKAHYHVVLKLKGRVRWIQIACELRARGIFEHLSLPTRYADIWRIVAYCYVPSARKPLPELDPDPLLSSNFPNY